MTGFAGIRAGYGMLLLLAPDRMVQLYAGHRADRAARAVARILGARHVVQAGLTLGSRDPAVLAVGAEVDLVHAATALGLATLDARRRRGGLVDAAAASLFAVAGATLADRAPPARPVGVVPMRRGARAEAAAWIAARTLPGPVVARLRGR